MEEKEMEQLFRQHYLGMYRLAKSYLYDTEESKDVVSEVFASLAHSQKSMIPETTKQYLMMSVRNRCLNIIKQKKLRERIIHRYSMEQEDRQAIGLHSSQENEMEERKQRIHDFIDRNISQQDQDIFRMRFNDEMSYQEIMKATGTSRMAVYKHLSRTINLIKEHFNPTNMSIGIIITSGIIFAAVSLHHSRTEQTPAIVADSIKAQKEQGKATSLPLSSKTDTTTVNASETIQVFDNVELENILSAMSQYYGKDVVYKSNSARHLHFHYEWNKMLSLEQNITVLNSFEHVNIVLEQDKIVVE